MVGWATHRYYGSSTPRYVHPNDNRVTLREEDVALLRRELHPSVTLTVWPEIAEGTQVGGYIYVGRSDVDIY